MDAHTHAQHPLATPQTRLDVLEPGDCLALVMHTFGRLPRESLVVIGLLNGRTGGHMRIDLTPALRDPFSSARLIADCLAGEGSSPAPEAALVVLIGDGPASAAQDASWRPCLDALRVMLESEYCVRIVQAWFVSGGHVRDPRCAVPGCCDLPGRSIDDLRVPTLERATGRSFRRETPPLDEAAASFLGRAPAVDPALAAALQGCRSQDRDQRDAPRSRRRLQAWDLTLRQQVDSGEQVSLAASVPRCGTPAETSVGLDAAVEHRAEQLAELLVQLSTGFERDLLIPLATLGLEAAMAALHRHQGIDEAPLEIADEEQRQDYMSCFLGETARRPDWDRVDALESVLRGMVPYALGVERENLLCLMAWIEWARGRGTAAGSFIDRCLEEFPDNEFSRLIERLMQLKGVCLWARVKQHSWSWSRSSTDGAD